MINIESHLEKLGVSLTAQLVNDIQNKLIRRRGVKRTFQSVVNASGNLAKSIRFEITNGTVLSFYGNDYIEFLQNGRRKGGVPPASVFLEWMDNKGIALDEDANDRLSIAYAIRATIKAEGTTIYKAGGSDLISGIFNEALQRSIEAEFAQLLVTEIQSDIFGLAA